MGVLAIVFDVHHVPNRDVAYELRQGYRIARAFLAFICHPASLAGQLRIAPSKFKLAHYPAVTRSYQTIVLENLNISGMSKNHALAGAILDASFREIRRQIEYKAVMKGGRVVIADRFFPSSKACSECGCVVGALPLSVREWTCAECGTLHDRDINAAINLEKLVGRATSEPLRHGAVATHGEIAALAAPQGAVKPRSENRELNRGCTHASTY